MQWELVESLARRKEAAPEAADTLLEIQVTSANPAFFRWDSLTSNVDDIFFIPANGFRRFNAPCPTNRLISWAQADINLAVLEGLRP